MILFLTGLIKITNPGLYEFLDPITMKMKCMSFVLLQVRTAYKKLMLDIGKRLVNRPDTEALMMEIYNFEESLAKVSCINTLNTITRSLSSSIRKYV